MTVQNPKALAPTSAKFDLYGSISPLAKAVAAGYTPSRTLGGWIATYGKIADDGSIVPTRDRQGHVFEAARILGGIDFTDYLAKGRWNDTHQGYTDETKHLPKIHVGVPTALEFHDGATELAKAHRKVGFWTEGHLWDRQDPRSWTLFGDYEPTAMDLDRADYFWGLSTMLKGCARPLGFSAQGKLLLSPCGGRIIWAAISQNAVCEMPQNPDSAALPMNLAVSDGRVLRPEMVGALPCDNCRCPPGARCKVIDGYKAAAYPPGGGVTVGTFPTREDLERDVVQATQAPDPIRYERLIALLMQERHLTEAHARRWVADWAKGQNQNAKA